MNIEAEKIENELVMRLLTLLKALSLEGACFVQNESYGSAIYVQDAECKVYNLDAFSERRVPSDKVLAIEYPDWLDDFILRSTWYLTPKNISAMISIKNRQFMFIFQNNSTFDEEEFNSMLKYDKAWNALMIKEKKDLPLAISQRRIRGLKVGFSRSQLLKIKRF